MYVLYKNVSLACILSLIILKCHCGALPLCRYPYHQVQSIYLVNRNLATHTVLRGFHQYNYNVVIIDRRNVCDDFLLLYSDLLLFHFQSRPSCNHPNVLLMQTLLYNYSKK